MRITNCNKVVLTHSGQPCRLGSMLGAKRLLWFGWAQPSTKDHVVTPSPLPSLGWGGELQKKGKLVGRDKGSLTERQRKRTATTTMLIRPIYKNKGIHRATVSPPSAQRTPKPWFTSPGQLLHPAPSIMAHSSEYANWPVWVSRPCCVPSWLLVKINPIPAEPRTLITTFLIALWRLKFFWVSTGLDINMKLKILTSS